MPKESQFADWDRFKAHYSEAGAIACWEWRGSKTRRGYGRIGVEGKRNSPQIYAHRLAYIHGHGPIPCGMCVCHACDNPACVNPAHLFLGTNADNTRDMLNKRRDGHGEMPGILHPNARLSEPDVLRIRELAASGISQRAIADEYGITQAHTSGIVRRKAWRHI